MTLICFCVKYRKNRVETNTVQGLLSPRTDSSLEKTEERNPLV